MIIIKTNDIERPPLLTKPMDVDTIKSVIVDAEVFVPADFKISTDQCDTLLGWNAVFGTLFIMLFCFTVALIVNRRIDDKFIKYALVCQIVALCISATMCFIITSYTSNSYLNEQTVPFQQVYFELPFYFFLVEFAAVLFSWQEMYEIFMLQCDEEADGEDAVPRDSITSLDRQESFLTQNLSLPHEKPLLEQQANDENSMTEKIAKIENRLSYWFWAFMGTIVLAQILNTFFVVFHSLDVKANTDTEETLRYKFGSIFYFIFFFVQVGMLYATWLAAIIIYARLATFLKPEDVNTEVDPE